MTNDVQFAPYDLDQATNLQAVNETAPALMYLATQTAVRSRIIQKQALDVMAGILSGDETGDCITFPWQSLRYEHSIAVRTRLIEIYAPKTVNRFLSAYRGVLRAAWRLGLMHADDYQRAIDVKGVKHFNLPVGRELLSEEIERLLTAARSDPSPFGVRDIAILAVLYGCGLRRAELAALTLENFDRKNGRLLVHGKGGKERYAFLPDGALMALRDWINIRGETPGALFTALSRSQRMTNPGPDGITTMTPDNIYFIVKRRASEAGIKNMSPHDFRRTYVGDLLTLGHDLSLVSRMVGHANVQTTAQYDRRPEELKQKAAQTLAVPYVKPLTSGTARRHYKTRATQTTKEMKP